MKKGLLSALQWFFIFLFGLVISTGGAISARADVTIFNSWNADGTGNNPSIDPVFTLVNPTTITAISNYHWYNGWGKDASLINGWIGIDQILSETESVQIGRWPAVSVNGPFGTTNTVWYAYPNTVLGPGTYKVVDSDKESWSYTVTDYYHYIGVTGKDWAPYKGFSYVWAAAADVCGDGLDNDGDGLIDLADPNCPPMTCATPPSGMIGWWPGDGNADDLVGTNNASMVNGATFAGGRVGQAFSFDGVDDRVEVPSSSSLDITGPLTIDAWFQLAAPLNSMSSPIVAKWGDSLYGGAGYGLALLGPGYLPGPANKVAFAVSSSGGDITLVASPNPIPLNEWHHLAGVYDGSTIKLYLDGALVTEKAYSSGINVTSVPLVMGSYNPQYTSFTGPLKGLLDEVEIFGRALADEEIALIYNAGIGGKCKFTTVETDIKPGSFPNSINLGNRGNVPVAVLGSQDFDVTAIDAGSVAFAGAAPLPIGGPAEDVNGDGLLDVVLHFATQDLSLQPGDTEACLTGRTAGGRDFKGCDSVRIIKK